METAYIFEGQSRTNTGTGAARALRNVGQVPSVLYGEGQEPVHFAVAHKEVLREYLKGGFFGKIVTLNIEGKKILSVPRDVQLHPVTDQVLHVDFQQVSEEGKVRVRVPVRFTNTDRCIGIRRGGAFNVVRRSIEMICPVAEVPEAIYIDTKDMNIGDSVHIDQVTIPEGAKLTIARNFTIVAVAGRVSRTAKEEEANA
ncbi:MAG: 50S ribosomal protein L25/general stress protein Ctc [Alphaproteobacteria bacterium]|nr:MAG: 50S ribosomal protein L25/general stress protein Ctc [Alphaproteobacteria bacterium]